MRSLERLVLTFLSLSLISLSALAQSPQKSSTGVITGRVSLGDKAAPGVVVVLVSSERLPERRIIARATTDFEGNYRLMDLAAGRYNVMPVAPTMVGPNETSYGDMGRSVIVAEGESVEKIDFALTRGGVITGRVTDADGRPVVEERLEITPTSNQNRMGTWFYSNPYMFMTDDRGIYRIYGLPAGSYNISLGDPTSEGMIRIGRDFYQRTYYPGETDIKKAGVIEVKEGGEVANVDIRLGRPAQSFAASGRVVDADTGKPVSEMMVARGAVEQGSNQMGSWEFAGRTDARGQFRIQGLMPGRYGAFAWSDGENYSDPVPFEVTDADVNGLEIKMRRGAIITGVARIEGTSDPRIFARLHQLSIGVLVRSKEVQRLVNLRAQIGADGQFRVTGVPPGKALFFIRTYPPPKDIRLTRLERDGVVVPPEGIEVAPGAEITNVRVIFDYGTGSLRGQIRVENGTLPDGARMFVQLGRPGDDPNRPAGGAEVDSRGRFLIEGLPAGDYQITLRVYNTQGPLRIPADGIKQSVSITNGIETETTIVLDLAVKEGADK